MVFVRTYNRLMLALIPGRDEEGQALVEYALLLALLAIVSVAVVQVVGVRLSGMYQSIVNVFP